MAIGDAQATQGERMKSHRTKGFYHIQSQLTGEGDEYFSTLAHFIFAFL
jgi:hypothetical protein